MRSQRRFPWLEILVIVLGILITISIGIPKYVRARLYLREEAAIQQIQAIHQAQRQYRARHGRYSPSLPELAAAGLIDSDLAGAKKLGYRFALSVADAGYEIKAAPVRFGSSGLRSFASGTSGVIHESYEPPADLPE